MARPLVDTYDGFARRPAGKAEHLAPLGIEPRTLEMHALVRLDRQVALVGLLQLLGGDAEEARVDIQWDACLGLSRRPVMSGGTAPVGARVVLCGFEGWLAGEDASPVRQGDEIERPRDAGLVAGGSRIGHERARWACGGADAESSGPPSRRQTTEHSAHAPRCRRWTPFAGQSLTAGLREQPLLMVVDERPALLRVYVHVSPFSRASSERITRSCADNPLVLGDMPGAVEKPPDGSQFTSIGSS